MFRLICFGLLSLIIICASQRQPDDVREVFLEGLGKVIGKKFWDGEFYEFLGIPYATVPKGRDRFKPPLPPTPWDEDMAANRGILVCQQVINTGEEDGEDELHGSEECLVASYMVPKIANETNLLPVVVYVHSGAFVGGSGNMAKFYHLTRQDVVVVNFNYRLGALGFLCLGTEDIPGNAALKDIVAALKFIKERIKTFGGDPDNITLAGYSVGAALAEIVALSKETRGFFNKLALDSSTALAPYAVNRHPLETARNIAISLGYDDTGSIEDLNDFYLEGDIEDLLSSSKNFFLKNSTFGFAPCIENPGNPEAVLTESPLDTLKKGNYGNFALLTGFGNMEGISRTSQFDEWRELMNKNLDDFLPADLAIYNDKEKDEFINELKQYYFNGKPLTRDSVREYIEYFSDSMFKYSIMKSVKLHAENLKRPIYLYEFTYVGKLNTQHAYSDKIRGASHRDASAYVLDFFDWTRNYTDMDMRDLSTFMWADFIKYENPTVYESTLNTVKWLKYTNKDPNYLDFGAKLVMKKDVLSKAYQLWDKVYNKYYWNPTVVDPKSYKGKAKTKTYKKKPVEIKPADESKAAQEPAAENTETAKTDKKPVSANPTVVNPDADKGQAKTNTATTVTESKPKEKKTADKFPTPTKPAQKPAPDAYKKPIVANPGTLPTGNPTKSNTETKDNGAKAKATEEKPAKNNSSPPNTNSPKPATAEVKQGSKEEVKK